jgi:hypothetical protein
MINIEIAPPWILLDRQTTGATTTTSTAALDVGFGNYLATGLAACALDSTAAQDVPAQQFFALPLNEQLYHGHYDTPKRFIRALSRTAKARQSVVDAHTESLKARVNAKALPVVYFYRAPGVQFADAVKYPIQKAAMTDAQGIYDVTPVELQYHVFVLGHDLPTLDRIANGLLLYWGLDTALFSAQTTLAGTAITLDAAVDDPRIIRFEDVSLPTDEARLFAYQADITVIGDVVRYRATTVTQQTLTFGDPMINHA